LKDKLGTTQLQDVELIMSKNIQEGILNGTITSYKNDLVFSNKCNDKDSMVDSGAQQ